MKQYISCLLYTSQTIRQKALQYEMVPNKAFFAAVKDFHDRISYSTFFDGSEEVEVNESWRELYERWCTVIWADEAKQYNGCLLYTSYGKYVLWM